MKCKVLHKYSLLFQPWSGQLRKSENWRRIRRHQSNNQNLYLGIVLKIVKIINVPKYLLEIYFDSNLSSGKICLTNKKVVFILVSSRLLWVPAQVKTLPLLKPVSSSKKICFTTCCWLPIMGTIN